MSTLNAKVILNVKTAAEWANSMEVLLEGELGIESDTRLIKIGNGVDTFSNLPYTAASDINDIEGVTVTSPTDGNVLTYSNGEWVNITPSSLPADTDLSHYDNTTSGFITASDIPALPADTDLSHYDNTTSDFATVSQIPTDVSQLNNDAGYITSSDLPTVGDGTITIQKNSVNVDSFTTNQNTNKTINITVPTLLSELTNDVGYLTTAVIPTVNNGTLTIKQDNIILATFTANSANDAVVNITSPSLSNYLSLTGGTMAGSIRVAGSGYTLGDSTQGWSTVYTSQVTSNSNTVFVGGNSSSIFYFEPTATATTNCLGSSNRSWSSGYIDSIYATNIKLTGALTVGKPSDVSAYKRITIKSYDGNTEGTLTDWAWLGYVTTGVFGFRPITSNTGTIGTTSELWNKGYFTNLCTTGIYSKYDPNTQLSNVGLYYNTHVIEVTPAVQWGYMGQKSASEIGIFPSSDNTYKLGATGARFKDVWSKSVCFSDYTSIYSDTTDTTDLIIQWVHYNTLNTNTWKLRGNTLYPDRPDSYNLGYHDTNRFNAVFSKSFYVNSDNCLTFSTMSDIGISWKYSNTTYEVGGYHTNFMPTDNNKLNLGASGYRWIKVFALSGTIDTSDRRTKDNIEPLEGALEKVNSIGIKSFVYKADPDHIHYGFIAQDELERNPELVYVPEDYSEEDDGGELGVISGNIPYLALRAIQELSSKVDELNAKIKVLEGRV